MRMTCCRSALALMAACILFACTTPPPQGPAPESTVKTYSINSGDTLEESLADAGLPPEDRTGVIRKLAVFFPSRLCMPGDRYEVTFDPDNQWDRIAYYPRGMEYYIIERTTGAVISASRRTRTAQKSLVTAQGTIKTSLWDSMASQKISPQLIVDFADIFAWQIDFLTEPRVGDHFKVMAESYVMDDGTPVSTRIIAAQYTASGQTYSAVLYKDSKGREDYYSPEGKSLRSAFLKAPLQFRRISSYFSRARFHPILKYYRPHLGIDYAAPSGTPVSAIGEGTVIFAGWKGGFGNYIIIRHPNNFLTHYGHLRGYAKGIRGGAHVRQGQVIGFVGSTGLSSGPHLDFRVKKDGVFVNFLRLRFPAAKKIDTAEWEAFKDTKRSVFTKLAEIR